MNSHYFKDLDKYQLDNEESIRPRWRDHRESKIGMDSQHFQPFRKEFLHTNNDNYKMTEERVEAFYREKEIIIKTFENQKIPPPFISWASACFPSPILEIIEQLKFESPTIIQSVVFPIILAGYDVIGIAQTGSGKTIAYLLPGLIQITSQKYDEQINTKKMNGPQMLILVPTRELANQIDSEIQLFTQNYRLKTLCIYGGINNRKNQFYNLARSPNILVATPGRLLDFLREGATTLADVSYLVIDEADRLLELGFENTIRDIVQQIRLDRQTVFFSATWPKAVKDLAFDFCQQSPIYVQIGKSNLTINKNIDQEIVCLFSRDKLQKLLDILDTLKISDKVLIFSEQKHRCEQLSISMADRGYYTTALHGDKTQTQRDEIMRAFRSGYTRLLCATDLASRGLDVTDITVVINYDFPKYFDDYIHRIGRTGRGEKKGKSFSFLAYDRDEPRMANELLKLAQVANLKYDESALRNFSIGIFPQMHNDFEFDKFKQQKNNFGFSKYQQDDQQKSRYSQDDRYSDNDKNYQKFQSVKDDVSNVDSNYNFRSNQKYQEQSQQQSRNQWKEYGNQKDYQFENEENRNQNYYQKRGDKKQFYGKQDRIDNRQLFDQNNNKFVNEQKERFYENDRRQFRQQGQDWSQRFDEQKRQIGQQEYGQDRQFIQNRQDRPKWEQFQMNQDENHKQDRFERQNNKQYDQREQQDDDKRFLKDRQDNRRIHFIDQVDDKNENSQQQYQSKIPYENNSFRQKQSDYWNNNKRQQPYQQRFGNNFRNYDNKEEDFRNSRHEECKKQYTNQGDEVNGQEWKNKQYNINQYKMSMENDRQHQFNNVQVQDNKRNQQYNRFERQEDGKSQQFRNNDQMKNQNQNRNYWDQNEKRKFNDVRQINNQYFDQYNNFRKQNDNQNRLNRNQVEQNSNENNKFKSHRNTQSLDRFEQMRFYNSKQITRNIVKNDDQLNTSLQQPQEQNNFWRNRNKEPQQNQDNNKEENQQINKQINNLNDDIKQSSQNIDTKQSTQIIQKQQGMEEINELQEYNFNYDPNRSSSSNHDGEIQEDNELDKYEKIGQNYKDHQDVNDEDHKQVQQSIPKKDDQIPTAIIEEQQEIKNEQNKIVENDNNQKENDKVDEDSDNEFDFTRFSRTLEQESQMQIAVTQQQQVNNNREISKEVE